MSQQTLIDNIHLAKTNIQKARKEMEHLQFLLKIEKRELEKSQLLILCYEAETNARMEEIDKWNRVWEENLESYY